MWKNKDIRIMILLQGLVLIMASIGCFFFSFIGHYIMAGAGFLIALIGYVVLFYRNKRIAELSNYLSRITNGEHFMDIRDNEEGELSYLKNEIYKVTRKLEEQAELLKKDKHYLADSMADISHQLKTPLTSMMVLSDLLQQELPYEKRKQFIDRIQSQLARMEWLVTSLLKLSKMDAGTIVMKEEVVIVKELVSHALETLWIPAELKGVTIQVEVEEGCSYIGDFEWSKEALTNVLKNCLEHTKSGGSLSVYGVKNPLYTEVEIKDTGEGIDKEDLPYIFKRFYRGKNASSDSVGIGLAMAKNIIMKQQGQIEVESEVGTGTIFHIKFYKR